MESGDEDEISMAQRDWDRMKGSLEKSGYRDGIGKGETDNLQNYTDQCRAVCQAHYEAIGDLLGLLLIHLCKCSGGTAVSSSSLGPERLQSLLDELNTYADGLGQPTSSLFEPGPNEPADSNFTEFLTSKSSILNSNFEKFKLRVCEVLNISSEEYAEFLHKLQSSTGSGSVED